MYKVKVESLKQLEKEKKRNPLAFESLLKFFGMPPLK